MASSDQLLVAFFDVYPELYGAQRSLFTLYSHWQREQRYRLHFLYCVEGELSEAIRSAGIPATKLDPGPLLGSFNKRLFRLRPWDYPRLSLEMYSYARTLRDILRREGADLLHANGDRSGLMSFWGARWAGCPMATHIRRDRSFGRLDRVIHAVSDEIVWVSRGIQEGFKNNNALASVKGRVIYNARVLPDAEGPSTRDEVRREFDLPDDALVALVVASLEERKDHETLVRAAEIVRREEPRAYFLLAGFDPSPHEARRKLLEQMVHESDLARSVLFLGQRNDVGRLMRGSDILVNPAKEEALGGALIEAMGYGLPCVATDTGGTGEIVPDNRCGYLVPRRDHRALAERTVALLRDEAAREEFGRNARTHFAEHFTIDRCAEQTAAFFDEIIARHSRSREGRR